MLARLAAVLIAAAHLASGDPFRLRLLVSGDVRGAVFPVDSSGVTCGTRALHTTPCNCHGGAARRATAVTEALAQDNGTLLVDTGGYFYGSGCRQS